MDLLVQENLLLKVEIKSLKEKLKVHKNSRSKTRVGFSSQEKNLRISKTPNINFQKPNNSTKTLMKYSKNLNRNKFKLDRNNDNRLTMKEPKRTSSSFILRKTPKLPLKKDNNDKSTLEVDSNKLGNANNKNKKKKQINLVKFVNSKNNNNLNKRNINIKIMNKTINNTKNERSDFLSCSPGPILSAMSDIIKKGKKERSSSSKRNNSNNKHKRDTHNYSPNNSFDLLPCLNPDFEEIEKDVNSFFDEELKQLEQDEDNIKKLLLQINDGNLNELISDKESGDI